MNDDYPEFAAIYKWLSILGIETLVEWDVLVFLDRHSLTLLTNGELSGRTGYDRAQLLPALHKLRAMGVLEQIRFADTRHFYRRIVPVEESERRAFKNLMELADNRVVRLALIERKPRRPQASESWPPPHHFVVGFGGSAGALGALRLIFASLPENTGLAFVVVQHMAPETESLLPNILARDTSMTVQLITDQMPIKPNAVFVIPPNRDLTITHGVLCLGSRTVDRWGRHRSIDGFFTSLAKDRRDAAISVILSGMDSDGILGTAAVKSAGGTTIVQHVDTAPEKDLPQNVIADGFVDFIATPEDIGKLLVSLARQKPR